MDWSKPNEPKTPKSNLLLTQLIKMLMTRNEQLTMHQLKLTPGVQEQSKKLKTEAQLIRLLMNAIYLREAMTSSND